MSGVAKARDLLGARLVSGGENLDSKSKESGRVGRSGFGWRSRHWIGFEGMEGQYVGLRSGVCELVRSLQPMKPKFAGLRRNDQCWFLAKCPILDLG